MARGFADEDLARRAAGGRYRLLDARVPLCLLDGPVLAADRDGLAAIDLTIESGCIASVLPAGTALPEAGTPAFDLDRGLVFPRFVDVHTHLDKGHIWPRAANPDGTFAGALEAVFADREPNWSRDDLRARMDFALRAAFAYGTGALRTHLDSIGGQTDITWPLFAELRAEWAGRIALQATALFRADTAIDEPDEFRRTLRAVARHGGQLGGVTFVGEAPGDKTRASIRRLFEAAAAEGLDLDLHVDESAAPGARTLEIVADTALKTRFASRVLVGHCCSLALMDAADAARVIGKLAEARIGVVSLPMCNMYLQDRQAGRTPRWRGVAPLHELRAGGVEVMVASDNTRDPFYAYGDLDMLESFREATRILQLDHSGPGWSALVASAPAAAMGLAGHGRIRAGEAADLVLFRARNFTELHARPQSDRSVLVAGTPVDTTLPDHRELDRLFFHQRHGS